MAEAEPRHPGVPLLGVLAPPLPPSLLSLSPTAPPHSPPHHHRGAKGNPLSSLGLLNFCVCAVSAKLRGSWFFCSTIYRLRQHCEKEKAERRPLPSPGRSLPRRLQGERKAAAAHDLSTQRASQPACQPASQPPAPGLPSPLPLLLARSVPGAANPVTCPPGVQKTSSAALRNGGGCLAQSCARFAARTSCTDGGTGRRPHPLGGGCAPERPALPVSFPTSATGARVREGACVRLGTPAAASRVSGVGVTLALSPLTVALEGWLRE